MAVFWLSALVFCASFILTWALRRYALHRDLIDIPNARSSHVEPTPRGGGVAIVVSLLAALPLISWLGLIPWPAMWGLWGAGCGVAIVGFLDDHGHIPARWRLLGHFLAAAWVLFWLGGFPSLELFGLTLDLGWWGHTLAAIWLAWHLNLYNFMDGIDGIAGVEAMTACLGAAMIYALLGLSGDTLVPVLLAASVAGFLIWNFPTARIFMGDAGSGFLGITLGAFTIQAAWVAPQLLWCWLILLGVFIVDATWTLMRRLSRGVKVYEAHRSHAYQIASRRLGAHLPVTLGVLAVNVMWLLPIALAVGLNWLDGTVGLAIAYAPLVWVVVRLKAGQPEDLLSNAG
ncbi:glycosyl transferase [Stutzerimonas stutzeri]|uniref:Glycosyl transferase n=1 Tax=Stutzerimonas stutzeri TaxID=316 RepID=W8QZU5_STUST|nr:glycosyl transferase [Stutzerimonas stutzeri]